MGGVGEVFVVDWACSVGWASSRGEIRYWPSNCIGAGDIGTWGCEGFVGNLAMWVCLEIRWKHRKPENPIFSSIQCRRKKEVDCLCVCDVIKDLLRM